ARRSRTTRHAASFNCSGPSGTTARSGFAFGFAFIRHRNKPTQVITRTNAIMPQMQPSLLTGKAGRLGEPLSFAGSESVESAPCPPIQGPSRVILSTNRRNLNRGGPEFNTGTPWTESKSRLALALPGLDLQAFSLGIQRTGHYPQLNPRMHASLHY